MTFIADNEQEELVTIQLTQYEVDLLNKPVNGIGGVQSLLRQLQQQLNLRTNKLTVTQDQIERIKKYRRKYGSTGGYQTRLAAIVKHLDAKGLKTLDGF